MLCIPAFFRTSMSGILSCHLVFDSFLKQLKLKWLSIFAMTLIYCPCLTCIQVGWQNHILVNFQLDVVCTESSVCHTGFCNSGSDLIINVHWSGTSASQVHVGEFINSFQFFVHSQCWFVHCTVFKVLVGVHIFVLIVRS